MKVSCETGVQVKTYNDYPNTVFIDGKLLPLQLQLPAIVSRGVVIVEIMTDGRVKGCVNPDKVPYQVRPYERFMHTNKKGMTVNATRLYLKYQGKQRPQFDIPPITPLMPL